MNNFEIFLLIFICQLMENFTPPKTSPNKYVKKKGKTLYIKYIYSVKFLPDSSVPSLSGVSEA